MERCWLLPGNNDNGNDNNDTINIYLSSRQIRNKSSSLAGVHIEKAFLVVQSLQPDQIFQDDGSNQSQESSADSNTDSFGAGRIFITPVKGGQQQKKYKQKEFSCPECGKGFCDAVRLKDHIETKHKQRNVGPNTDIAVRNRAVTIGYEVYKVLGLYSTGLRIKAVRFAACDHDKWILTK